MCLKTLKIIFLTFALIKPNGIKYFGSFTTIIFFLLAVDFHHYFFDRLSIKTSALEVKNELLVFAVKI